MPITTDISEKRLRSERNSCEVKREWLGHQDGAIGSRSEHKVASMVLTMPERFSHVASRSHDLFGMFRHTVILCADGKVDKTLKVSD